MVQSSKKVVEEEKWIKMGDVDCRLNRVEIGESRDSLAWRTTKNRAT